MNLFKWLKKESNTQPAEEVTAPTKTTPEEPDTAPEKEPEKAPEKEPAASAVIGSISIGMQSSGSTQHNSDWVIAKNVICKRSRPINVEVYTDEEGNRKTRVTKDENVYLPVAEDGHTAEDVCQWFIDELKAKGKTECDFRIEQRSEEYLSVFYGLNDFLRVKYTPSAKWLSLDIESEEQKQAARDSGLFVDPHDNRRHWASNIKSFDSLSDYMPIAEHSCYRMYAFYEIPATPEEQVIIDKLKEIFVSEGADPNYIRGYGLSGYARFSYVDHTVEIKVYKKKPARLTLQVKEAKKAKIELYKANDYQGYYDLISDDSYIPLSKYAKYAIKNSEEKRQYYIEHPDTWKK